MGLWVGGFRYGSVFQSNYGNLEQQWLWVLICRLALIHSGVEPTHTRSAETQLAGSHMFQLLKLGRNVDLYLHYCSLWVTMSFCRWPKCTHVTGIFSKGCYQVLEMSAVPGPSQKHVHMEPGFCQVPYCEQAEWKGRRVSQVSEVLVVMVTEASPSLRWQKVQRWSKKLERT